MVRIGMLCVLALLVGGLLAAEGVDVGDGATKDEVVVMITINVKAEKEARAAAIAKGDKAVSDIDNEYEQKVLAKANQAASMAYTLSTKYKKDSDVDAEIAKQKADKIKELDEAAAKAKAMRAKITADPEPAPAK